MPLAPLHGAGLFQHSAGPPFRHPLPAQRISYMLHRRPAFHRAQKFPEFASFRISLSSDRSATSFFSRVFSVSSAFIRFA